MRCTSRRIFGVITGLLALLSSLALAADRTAMALPAAQLVAVEGASGTYQLTDYDGRIITLWLLPFYPSPLRNSAIAP